MAAILWLGTGRAAAGETRSLLEELLRQWFPGLHSRLSPALLTDLNVIARKSGHFFGYALLGLLDARALRLWRRRWTTGTGLAAWGAAGVWAGVDELHQSLSPSRGATWEDVVLDAAGAVAGVALYSLWMRRTKSACS